MIPGISASLSGLSAFARKLAANARNIANCNTDGFKKSEATIGEDKNGFPEVTLWQSDSPGAVIEEAGVMRETSNVDLIEEFPQMIIAQRGYEANIKALKAQDEVLESTLDILA
jgi:flagellar basal body rod protein FlgG